ncbi:reticulon-4b [Trichomycterus rosablanca]|uniref:reticulon-4b n=1 Tax=Trichomycterus rosablanca TaxID=2290929 RepID=UPI002F356415
MADADQVSSTTPNEVVEEEFKPWHESGTVSFSDAAAAAHKDGGFFGEEQYVMDVPRFLEGSATGGAPFTLEPKPVTRLEKEEEVLENEIEIQAENKAETEWLEKSNLNLISEPVQEPDSSTQNEYAFNLDLEKQEQVVTEGFAGLEQDFSPDVYEKEVTQDQDSVASTPTESEDLISEKEVTLGTSVEHFTSEVIQEQMISTTHAAQTQEDIFSASPDQEQSPEQDFDIITSVKEKVFRDPGEAFRSDFGEERSTAAETEPVLKDPISSAPAEAPPAAPASPSSNESSLLFSAADIPFSTLMQFTSENKNSSIIDSQATFKTTMDSFGNDSSTRSALGHDPDVLNQSDDDLMFETKKNPFQDFSPVDKLTSEFSHFGETTADVRAATMSDSPSPDLVQNAHDAEIEDIEEESFESREAATESLRQQLASSDFFTSPNDQEASGVPPSLPDILKSSPLKSEKLDSGSSEGSPDVSPVHRRGNDSPNAPVSMSANNPFAFETKVPLLKEMTEETEARAAEKARLEKDKVSEQLFGTFDLVKETETSPKGNETIFEEQEAFKTSKEIVDKFECLNLPTKKDQGHSDSESPSPDSLSPVLEAMNKTPAHFQLEPEKNVEEEEEEEEEAEAADEISEQEASSEEFEFVEKPPRGAVDEFLETLENSKFTKASEVLADDDTESKFAEMVKDASPAEEESKNQTSYFLLTEASDVASQTRGKAGLELSSFQVPSQSPVAPSPVIKIETVPVKKEENKDVNLPNLSGGAVVELLYWRDVKNSGIVFGASLLLLLSLSVCSIISVLSYVALALLSVTISFRIYKGILQAIQKSDEGHPFKLYLEQEVALPEDLVHKYSEVALGRLNTIIIELRRLFLVDDLVDSLKFAVFMWILTYIGALFNGLTLLILGLVGAFSCPVVYEKHQVQIDHYIALVSNQVKDVVGKIQAKIPGAKKKSE